MQIFRSTPPASHTPPGTHPARSKRTLDDYRAAKELVGESLSSEQIHLLRDADHARRRTYTLLPFGRGNVAADIAVSRGLAHVKTQYARLLASALTSGRTTSGIALPLHIATAASGRASGAGNCAEYTQVGIHEALDRFRPGDAITSKYAERFDHTWFEWARPSAKAEVVVDSHSGEPPMLKNDTVYGKRGNVAAGEHFSYREPSDVLSYKGLYEAAGGSAEQLVGNHAQLASQAARIPEPPTVEARTIAADKFTKNIRQRLQSSRTNAKTEQKQIAAVRRVAEQNGCDGEIDCSRQARSLLDHLREVW